MEPPNKKAPVPTGSRMRQVQSLTAQVREQRGRSSAPQVSMDAEQPALGTRVWDVR
jgi:hypothetical protein